MYGRYEKEGVRGEQFEHNGSGGGGDMVANECYTPYCLNYVCSTFVAVNAGERAKIKHNRYVRGWNHISWDENKNQ